MRQFIRKTFFALVCGLVLAGGGNALTVHAAEPVIVIDPGHGGTNMGAQYHNSNEKDLTLKIATAMYQELTKYEGITVYMTRTADTELSLKERADIAAGYGAEFLFSIHLNASGDHRLFGAEVWVPTTGAYYRDGYQFGMAELEELQKLGIYSKGVKTKTGKSGEYYGILKHCKANGIKSAIIEHAYMDQAKDEGFVYSDQALTALGKADATAVAKYYGLKSATEDYSTYQKVAVKEPKGVMRQDDTPPDECRIYDAGEKDGKWQIKVKTKDLQSPICYFDFSTDGGKTFSDLGKWLADTEGTIEIPKKGPGQIVVRTYNNYYGMTASEVLNVR